MKQRILIIDDEKDLCELMKSVLIKEGFHIDCAYTLNEAYEKLKANPEIILLDNNLPDGSGVDYLQMNPAPFMNSHVIIITSDPVEAIQHKIKRESVTSFLQKPFTIRSMRELIKQVA
jgi:DNA-binding response OmpR family regulator